MVFVFCLFVCFFLHLNFLLGLVSGGNTTFFSFPIALKPLYVLSRTEDESKNFQTFSKIFKFK